MSKFVWCLTLVFLLCSCQLIPSISIKPTMCKLVQIGIDKINDELSQGDVAYTTYVIPAAQKIDAKVNIDDLKEIWDKIPTEDKLKAALAALTFINEKYCGATSEVTTETVYTNLENILKKFAAKK